jgi:hypothetical protein
MDYDMPVARPVVTDRHRRESPTRPWGGDRRRPRRRGLGHRPHFWSRYDAEQPWGADDDGRDDLSPRRLQPLSGQRELSAVARVPLAGRRGQGSSSPCGYSYAPFAPRVTWLAYNRRRDPIALCDTLLNVAEPPGASPTVTPATADSSER